MRLNEIDNVAIARRNINVGEEGAVVAIPKGHKVAICDIAQGQPIIKYAQIIGYASRSIPLGMHVHVENLEFRNVQKKYEYGTNMSSAIEERNKATFLGFKRPNGKVGTRNTIAI
jgi:Altronate dehydratase